MFVWKEIDVTHLEKNKSDLDMNKMFKSGAVKSDGRYAALEIEKGNNTVKVLAQLERGFEEYVTFDKTDYDFIPEIPGR